MTELEIIAEMHTIAIEMEQLRNRLNELKDTLYRRDEFARYIKSRQALDDECQDESEDIQESEDSDVKDKLFQMIRAAKDRNGKGLLHSTAINRLTQKEKEAMDSLIRSRAVLKVRIGTNYYYTEAS